MTIDWEIVDDSTVLDRLRAGEEEAFAVLYRRHGPLVLGLARRWLDGSEAEDVLHDVFMNLYVLATRGEGPTEHVRGYVAASARHEAMRRARRQQRCAPSDLDALPERAVPFAQGQVDPDDLAVLRPAMRSLSERHRAVLWAVEVEGYRPREIAAEFGLGANALAALACRARRSLAAACAADH